MNTFEVCICIFIFICVYVYLILFCFSDVPIDEYMKRILAFAGLVHGNNCVAPVNCYTEANLHPIVVEVNIFIHVILILLRIKVSCPFFLFIMIYNI